MSCAALGFVGPVHTTACTQQEDCGEVACPPPIRVSWPPEAFPDDLQVRLCVNRVCGSISPAIRDGSLSGGMDYRRDVVEEATVRLELVNADSVVVRTVEGSGTPKGKCCKTLSLRLSSDGESLVE